MGKGYGRCSLFENKIRYCKAGPLQKGNERCSDSAEGFLYNRKLRSLLYKNAPRRSHCGGEEIAAFAARRRRRILQSRILCSIPGNFVPCYIKTLRGDRTAAEKKIAAFAARRRRRILQSRILSNIIKSLFSQLFNGFLHLFNKGEEQAGHWRPGK